MYPKFIVFTIAFFVIQLSGICQTWEIEWEKQMGSVNSDGFTHIIEDVDGNFIVLGSTQLKEKKVCDFWLVKFDSEGNLIWTRTYETENYDYPSGLAQFKDGSYILSGKTGKEENNLRAFILKADTLGNEVWRKNIGNEFYKCAENIIVMDNGEFIVSGIKASGEEIENIFLTRFKEDGEIIWEKLLGDNRIACSQALRKLPDGGFVIAGKISEKGIPNSNLLVARYSKESDKIWDKEIESSDKNVWPECICCSPDSNLIIVGWHGTCMDDIMLESPTFDYDLFITKMSQQGEILWTKNVDSEGSEGGNAVIIRADGKILLAGKKETSFLGRIGPWLLLSDENGEILSELLLPFKFNRDQAADIINTADGGFVVIGPGQVGSEIRQSNGWIRKFKAF